MVIVVCRVSRSDIGAGRWAEQGEETVPMLLAGGGSETCSEEEEELLVRSHNPALSPVKQDLVNIAIHS